MRGMGIVRRILAAAFVLATQQGCWGTSEEVAIAEWNLQFDCVTPGGMRVQGTNRCDQWALAQAAAEFTWQVEFGGHPSLKGVVVTVHEIQEGDDFWRHRGGLAGCDFKRVSVGIHPGNTKWINQTAFFHEAVHVFDQCNTPNHEGWTEKGFHANWIRAANVTLLEL